MAVHFSPRKSKALVFSQYFFFLARNSCSKLVMEMLKTRWQESLSRFEHVFGLNSQGKVMDIPTFYITGNHDVGYSRVASHKGDV